MNFTNQQQTVINLENGTHLVLAPAGTGKSEVLASRLIRGIELGKDETKMVCLTFTNRASQNMIQRVQQKLKSETQIFIGNIHNFSSNFLYQNGVFSETSSLINENESLAIFQNDLSHLDIFEIGKIKKLNSYLKAEKLNIPLKLLQKPESNIFQYRSVCENYEKIKTDSNLFDFDDILLLTYKYLIDNPDKNYQFDWIQVDEVQDLNSLQWAIIE